jgi:predicted metal-binding membrane protein
MHLAHPAPDASNLHEFGFTVLMWLGMSVAMMLPAATPAIRAFAGLAAIRSDKERRSGPLGAFVGGYLAVWAVFGLLAASAQWLLASLAQRATALHAGGSTPLAGVLLVVAGLYQFSALKTSCLKKCRSPLAYFLAHWRAGARGAFELGQRHGLHCLGCCWALMALMLIGGAMSLSWAALLTALLLAEKIAPAGPLIGRTVGLGLVGWGGALLAIAARA